VHEVDEQHLNYDLQHKPRLLQLLRSIGLDVEFHRSEGDFLYYLDDHQCEVEVLDLVGGHGAMLLGHFHPAIVAEAQRILLEKRPVHAQGSVRGYAERLARELSHRAKANYSVVFANSGTEVVEAAMKHAMLETGFRTFLALEGAFHGKTLGSLQLASNERFRKAYELSGLRVIWIRQNDREHIETTFASTENIAGLIFEPILGEGGVRPVEPAFATRMADLCAERNIPLIADECQTGVGRTGTFLSCEKLGVQPDYVILSKALGGGLAKISALLVRCERFLDIFDLTHTSAFADDDFSCAIALRTLQILDEATLRRCREKGGRLLHGLRRLQEKFSGVIADVRGCGLMLGVEFHRLTRSPSFVLRLLSSQEELLYVLTGYLFNVHCIRVAPTLSDPFTLRLQPSAFIQDDQIDRLLIAMDDLCQRLSDNDALGLTNYLLDLGDPQCEPLAELRTKSNFVAYDAVRFHQRARCAPSKRIAWLCHMIDADDLVALEPDFGNLAFWERQRFLDQFASRANPVVMSAVDIHSRTGDKLRLYPILLPVTSQWIKRLMDMGQYRFIRSLVQRGVDAARSLGCSMVSLGQYTSIVTCNGRKLESLDMGRTTGNSYAIALVIQAIQRAEKERGRDPAESVLAVVGAAGNIGRTCAEMLAPFYRRTILLGSDTPGSIERLRRLSVEIPNATITTEISAVADAGVVVVATNSVSMPLGLYHFAHNAVVCDVSVPPSVQSQVGSLRPDLVIIQGGIVRLPYGEDLEFVGFPLPPGEVYACMAEGLLLGFESVRDAAFTGPLTPHQVRKIEEIALRHGFELADFKISCVLGSDR
jgi:acetylornithine/succinyldiaminopimelate/putrescine aminotransferase/predicted amino acid dehydrogenase